MSENDKDPHGMYAAEPSELAALQIQIRRVVDQCEAVIGEKAHAIPFGMAVSETIAELCKRAELAGMAMLERLKRAETALTGVGWSYTEGAERWKPPVLRDGYAVRFFDLEDKHDRLLEEVKALRAFKASVVSLAATVPPTATVAGRCV